MNLKPLTKSLAILLNVALVGTSSFADIGALGAASAMPDFVKNFTPPARLGYVESFYQGQTKAPVILIQDLHANYGVQKEIEGMLNFLQPKVTAGGHRMNLGVEGAWGEINLAKVRGVAQKLRQRAADFLLKEVEISGMEHFVAMSPTAVHYVGIENPEDYFVNAEVFRKSLMARLELSHKIDQLRSIMNASRDKAPRSLRHIWKVEESYRSGRIGLDELSKKLGTPINNYGEAEAAVEHAKESIADAAGDKAFFLKNLVKADSSLDLLSRLLRQELTRDEVAYASQHVGEMVTVVSALLPGENMGVWRDAIKSALDYYAVALIRNKPMSEHALELAKADPDAPTVIVTGGFHTEGIANEFRNRGVSYIVIAPIVEAQTARDERLYLKRMMDIHVTDAEIAQAAHSASPRSASLTPLGNINAEGMPLTATTPSAQTWDRTVNGLSSGNAGELQRIGALTPTQEQEVQRIDNAVNGAEVKVDGFAERAVNYIEGTAGISKEVEIQRDNESNVIELSAEPSAPSTASSPSESIKLRTAKTPKPSSEAGKATIGTIGMYSALATVGIAAAAARSHPGLIQNVLHSPSTAIAAGIVALGGLGALWAKKNPNAVQRVKDAAFKIAA